jgi:hypothetical protein
VSTDFDEDETLCVPGNVVTGGAVPPRSSISSASIASTRSAKVRTEKRTVRRMVAVLIELTSQG